MRGITRRRVFAVVGVALALGVIAGSVFAVRVVSVLVAYKAKMLCSEVLLAHRDPLAVLSELEVDDLTPLRYVSASVDSTSSSASASFAGVIRHEARYEHDRGCRLMYAPTPIAREASPPRERHDTADSLISATNQTLDPVLDRAFSEPDPERPRRTRAVVVVHGGRIVAERYAPGFTPETPLIGWSMTKTVVNALVGVLVKEGRVTLDTPVPIPEWRHGDDPRSRITLRHLLGMSSGLRFNESPANPLSDAVVSLLRMPDTAMYAVRQPLDIDPGARWQYSSGTTNVIAQAIRNVLADDRAYASLPRRALFDPLAMRYALIEADASGTFVGSSFMYATAREWARLGMLYVNDGVWEGQRMLPEGWVTYTRSPAAADPGKRYGAHVWLKVADQYGGNAMLPDDAFHAIGHAGQFVTMIPSANLVVVRLGLTRFPNAWDHTAFVREVIDALGVRS